MSNTLFSSVVTVPTLPVKGLSVRYPVRRIFCVGRNYEAHAAEMGAIVDREAPFYFIKSATHLCESGASVPYPPGTSLYHHEVELVVALGADLFKSKADKVWEAVFGYACGLDMTRRDLQNQAKEKSRPWDISKDFEKSAVISMLTQAAGFRPENQKICLDVNEKQRQSSTLNLMIWSVSEILCHLSGLYHLGAGDLIMMGTPEGVGPVVSGDRLRGTIEGLAPVDLVISDSE